MMNEVELRKSLPDESSGSGQTFGTSRHPSIIDPILSKRVCFYKSGDPQFSGLRLVINNRTFKTFDALLDSLSKKVPLPFGVRNITTPRGIHAINSLDELKDGKSYICSDSRKVKPINLALARKKLPPWYHARPVSSRRRTIQQGRFLQNQSIHKQESVLIRTPKSLLVFRNGDPTVKHTVVLQKKTTPTYEAILEYISELMRFHVVKLHTPDGRRVDGVPGLILCSGTVVAVGREPFRPADYNSQKSPSPTWLHTKQMSFKRPKSLNRKKKSRNFSSSSESYIVRQIHNTIAESSCDIHSNPTNSVELESKRILESVAETDGDGAEGHDYMLPSDDNIEKSFQVNQDGSMTVEMKVRLTIKEEESIQWTTTLTRSSVSSQLNAPSLPETEAEQDISSPKSSSLDRQSPAAIVDAINKDKTKDNNDDDPPSLGNGALSESSNEEENVKKQSDVVSSGRAPTPGCEQIGKRQASVESIKAVTEDGIQQGIVGSYTYKEQTGNGTMTEQYCLVRQSSTRPVPKPRRLSSLDVNSKNVFGIKSAEMSEILQIESSEEEVTETIIHIYEQQTCQDNFLANVCTHPATTAGRPATSETGQLSQNTELERCRPSSASESISIWKTESMSIKSQKTGAAQGKNRQEQLQKPRKGQLNMNQRERGMDKRTSSKPKAVSKHVRRPATPQIRQKQNTAGATRTRKKVKTFSSAGFIRRIYGNKMKSSKSMKSLKKGPTQNGDRSVATKRSEVSGGTARSMVKESNVQSAFKNSTERVSFDTSRMSVSPNEVHQARGILTRQASMHVEKRSENESYDITGTILPAFNSSSTVTNEYVESWLQKAQLDPPSRPHEKRQTPEAGTEAQTENGRCEDPENQHGLLAVEEEIKRPEIQTCQTSDPPPPPEGLPATSVKLRVQSFENKSSPSLENATARQQIAHHHTTTKNTENWTNDPQKEEIHHPVPPSDKTSTETQLDSEVENKSSSIRISFQKATPLNTLSMELPPPPPPAENTELSNTAYCMNDAPSVVSSPLYRLSSVSSEGTDNNPLSINPTAGKAVSFTASATAPPSRTPSTKRAPLVSNLSLERKMSLRKACVDKYALSSEATPEETTLSTHTVGSDGVCSTQTHQPIENKTEEAHQSGRMSCPSCGTSASPTSLTSEGGRSSPSISSNDASVPSNIPFKEREMTKATQKEASTPKVHEKKAKVKTSPSPERKFQNQKSQDGSLQLSTEQSQPEDKTLSPNIGILKHTASYGSPSIEKKQINEPKLQKRRSPYSQSLDMMSPPVKHKSSRKLLSRDLSSDNPSEPATRRQKKTSVQRKSHQTPELVKSKSEQDKLLSSDTFLPLEADQSVEKKAEGEASDQEKSMTDMQIMKPLTIANQPSMKPVLEKICYSIKSIRQMTQNKRPSCLEKSNSLPDFSSHVASTFGSSSRALLAFLSVMTLKEGVTNLNRDELNANNVSCAEALKMIDSLREIASIEDSHRLQTSLSNLQKSASKQLLQSWKGFQELGDRCKSRSSTPSASEPELITGVNPKEEDITEENIIDELMENLDVPEKLKVELASLSVSAKTECDIKELWPKESSDESTSIFPKEDAATVPDAAQDDKADVEVRSSIKKVTDINQTQQCGEDRSYLITEEAKANPIVQATKDDNPPADSHSKQVTGEKQLLGKASFAQESKLDLQCQHASAENIIEGEVTSEKNLENESGADDEGQKTSSGSKELAEKESCKQSATSSEAGELKNSEENEPEAAFEELRQGSSEAGDLSNPENHSEEEDGELPSPSYYVELNVREVKSIFSLDSDSQTEVKCTAMSKDVLPTPVCLSSSEKEEQNQAYSMGLNISADESTGNSDVDKSSSEEEQPEAECKKLQVIAEESFSCIEEEEEDMEEKQLHELPDDREQKKTASSLLSALTEEPNEDKVSSEDEDSYIEETYICDETKTETTQSNLIENQVSEKDSLIGNGSNTDDDSGNDHNSFEEHIDEEQLKVEDEQISSSIEELSYYEKEPSSEEEQAHVDRYKGESCVAHEEAPAVATQSQATNPETCAEKLQHQSEEIMPQSVAERVILLEKRVADAEKRKGTTKSSAVRCYSQIKARLDSDEEDSPCESLTSVALCTRSAPQSSLSFSYDSSGVVTTEPEGSRVRSIREMFLAKRATDIQRTRFPSPHAPELELRAETSVSGGYQSQTSSEMSSGEDDLSKKSITKGFVRRTIERLYGKKDGNPDEEAGERPPLEPKQEKNGQSSIFAPFHTARSKAMSELSYFYSTNALDTLSEATRCIAFNAQVGPGDSIPIDDGRWLLRDNTCIRKSVSDPIGINKTFTKTPESKGMCEDTEDNTPYSLFATKPEPEEDKTNLFSRKCTYFSLPHASESDTCQDELSTASRNSANGDSVAEAKDSSEDTKTWADRNGMLPTMADFKMMDNKVHPVTEPPPEDEVVVVQPGKGQGVVNRRLPEQDILDVMYNFCGQHCPLL